LLLIPSVLAAAPSAPPGGAVDVQALRAAIQDLAATFGQDYPQAKQHLADLDRLQAAGDQAGLHALQRRALLANPLLTAQPILFVTRGQYVNTHGTEETMYQTGEICTQHFRGGGSLKLLRVGPDGSTSAGTLLEQPAGVVRDPEVSFDGCRVLLSIRRDIRDDYHLYELELKDGPAAGPLRQLTFAPRVSDIQPVYLPNGQILFSSTREPKYIPCQRHLMANLHVMNADGSNIRQIGHNTQFEGRSSLLDDGRVLYTRWEYVDKHFASAYGLWTVNPDGANHARFFGGYEWQPGPMVDARQVSGTSKIVCVYTAVHELGWGAMVLVDPARGLEGFEPIVRSWPADISGYMNQWDQVGRVGGGYDSFRRLRVKHEDPWPLSEKYFLCSRSLDERRTGEMGIFLVDVFGNEVLVHYEAPGCFDPMPLGPRPRPRVVEPRIDLARDEGVFYVQDVYEGAEMAGVERGTVRAIRIVEAPPKLTFPPAGIGDWTPPADGDAHHPVAVNWHHYNHKRVLGTVPVEADGSAHFALPAGRFVYFQLLDENGLLVHSMRSGTSIEPGETLGCVGCHERRETAPPYARKTPQALRRPPSRIAPWHGNERIFNYAAEVQPVLDKHCIGCHDYGKKGAAKMILCGDTGVVFNASYCHLMAASPAVWSPPRAGEVKPLISTPGSGPTRTIAARTWGSCRSRLIDMLRAGHNDVKLSREELDRVATWIDLNAPYYPTHATNFPTHTFGRSPLDHKQLLRLGQVLLAGPRGKPWGWNSVNRYSGERLAQLVCTKAMPINFTRPELSLCLQAFASPDSDGYREALALIRAGQAVLAKSPGADKPGFRPCEDHQKRLDYYAQRRAVEARNREAILQHRKVYDQSESANKESGRSPR